MTRTLRGAAILALTLVALGADARPAAAQNSVVHGTVGGVGGLIAGTTVSLGLIVANARMERDFIHGPDDIFSLQGVPIPVGLVAGGVLGASDPARAERVGYYTAAGMALGSGWGAIIGEAMTDDDPSGKWAGSVRGSAAGVVIGILLGSL
jgi:hypothetical protein